MGVTGLWTVVQPCARPIKIETLNKKRLAVDASIWIYQFLKAVRDKEGNALRNSHVVGFFRRICKLLFIGIKPVFVFDGGAPALKRQTIQGRKKRREGRREDATRTAGKLLALQMQRIAEEDEANRKRAAQGSREEEEEDIGEDLVYVDELQMTQKERQQNRKFKKTDQYHLPNLDVPISEMAPNDPRIMSLEELEAYARQFETGEDINVYDFSKIDFDSPFFTSLPASDRYNILNAARLRSRLRMGYSKEQLDTMFPDRMAFSKFQIERVTERNELTQRLMNINGPNDDGMFSAAGGRIAGEKGREYILVKNDGVEGGWALGVVGGNDEGRTESKPIDVDRVEKDEEEEDSEEDVEFEDVPIEGLNRLPKMKAQQDATGGSVIAKRRAGYSSRRRGPAKRRAIPAKPVEDDPESLFVADEEQAGLEETEETAASDDDDLQRAIAMSLEQDNANDENDEEEDGEDWLDLFEQKRADEERPLPRGKGMAIAHIVNSRAGKAVPAARSASPEQLDDTNHTLGASAEHTNGQAILENDEDDSDSDDMDFQSALAESRQSKYQPHRKVIRPEPAISNQTLASEPKKSGFGGPLPFEKLDLGSSLLGKKKMQKIQEESAGGFERADGTSNKKSEPVPPWFEGNLDTDMAAQRKLEQEDREKAKIEKDNNFQFDTLPTLHKHPSREVIDLEADEEMVRQSEDVIQVDSSDDEMFPTTGHVAVEPKEPTMGDMADAMLADPPSTEPPLNSDMPAIQRPEDTEQMTEQISMSPKKQQEVQENIASPNKTTSDANDEPFEWEDSDDEERLKQSSPAGNGLVTSVDIPEQCPSPEFEDVDMADQTPATAQENTAQESDIVEASQVELPQVSNTTPAPVTGTADQNLPAEAGEDEFGYYSDSEDDELMRTLAVEAEEHARFASTLNNKTQAQNIQDYERELKQLRTQQKKDRRDADEVTQVMIQECQQLLKLFGLPYITAPMEAEAQCAELVTLGLVDGIVTDDSDCFLFGGTRIYKNMFNQAKFVECYLGSDLEKEFDLTRQKLIGIAHLLGSDYTEGLTGVGPVTALEILSEFPSLVEFKKWFEGVQMGTLPKSTDTTAFQRKFRRQATKIFLPPAFPDPRVDLAYLEPEVDSDPSPFQWGVPNLDALRSFLMATIGWSAERTDEVLVPVIKDMNRRLDEGTQSNITKFFEGGVGAGAGAGSYAPRKKAELGSKRLGSALGRLADKAKRKRGGVGSEEDATGKDEEAEEAAVQAENGDEDEPEVPAKKKRNTKPSAAAKRGGKRGGRKAVADVEDD